jgi:SAM-dependent methyltransferase
MTLAESWDRYAAGRAPRRAVNARGEATWLNWTQYPDHGPSEEVLGGVAGRRVLDLGAGSGDNLAHLATLGAVATGVDIAPSRKAVADERWAHLPDIAFVTAEATAFLRETTATFDVVLSIFGAAWFVAPDVLLPLIRGRMPAGGLLAFSHLPPGTGPAPGNRAGARQDHSPAEWRVLLGRHGFGTPCATVLEPPHGETVGTMLIRAAAV